MSISNTFQIHRIELVVGLPPVYAQLGKISTVRKNLQSYANRMMQNLLIGLGERYTVTDKQNIHYFHRSPRMSQIALETPSAYWEHKACICYSSFTMEAQRSDSKKETN